MCHVLAPPRCRHLVVDEVHAEARQVLPDFHLVLRRHHLEVVALLQEPRLLRDELVYRGLAAHQVVHASPIA